MKQVKIIVLLFAIILGMAGCSNTSERIEVYELLYGDTFSPVAETAILENPNADIWFVYFEHDPDTSYPVYKNNGGEYEYYFTVKDGRRRSYFFNYHRKRQ